MGTFFTLAPTLYFSYRQFAVYDHAMRMTVCSWEDAHSAQGFARRESVVSFNALFEFGEAFVLVREGAFEARDYYRRVVAVPFLVTSGTVMVDGPEEHPLERSFRLTPGNYRLVAAQYIVYDDDLEAEQGIDLCFEPLADALEQSEILVADDKLQPIYPLLETAGIVGEE